MNGMGGMQQEHESPDGYGDNDQNQYENEGQQSDMQPGATQQLVGSRVARKRAEEDVKLLSNRI